MGASRLGPEPCSSCRAPLAADQRYCLRCGTRCAAPRVEPALAWTPAAFAAADTTRSTGGATGSASRGGATAAGGATGGGATAGGRGGDGSGRRGGRRPSRSAAAALVGGFLLVGGVLGAVLGSPTESSDAASAAATPPVILVDAAPAAAPSVPATTTDSGAADSASASDTGGDAGATDSAVADDTAVADDASADASPDTSADTGDDTSSDDTGAPDATTTPDDDTGTPSTGTTPTTTTAAFVPPAVGHVWIVTLTGQDYAALFGPASTAPYLHNQLAPQGTVLKDYTPAATSALAGGIGLLSGQSPNDTTTANCPTYVDATPTAFDGTTGFADATAGCVYPKTVPTLAGQVTGAGKTWRAYLQGEGDDTPCRHPALGQPDPWAQPVGDNGYLTQRNPFVYFHAIVDDPSCATNVVDADQLTADLADPTKTPAVSWIVPDAFHSGATGSAPDGTATGAASADAFLALVVPQILASKAYTDDGLIVVVPDAPAPVAAAPASRAATAAPVAAPTPTTAAASPAIAPTGALLVSPFVRKDKKVHGATGPYQLLRSIEDLFALSYLGHAGDTSVAAYDGTVYASSGTAASSRTNTIRSINIRTRPGGRIAPYPTVR